VFIFDILVSNKKNISKYQRDIFLMFYFKSVALDQFQGSCYK